jgi:serine/threonine-protein kinase
VVSGTAGEQLGGRYRLLDPIGTGGMSVVWRARDSVLDRDVAVKVLSVDLAADVASRERIRAEALAVAKLQHPNITSVHDYGESTVDGAPYVVMELLQGHLLSNRLRASRMSWRQATQIGAQVAAALAAAHERGVVHRDIKPSNVMLTGSGAKVLDFGVAGLAGSPDDDDSGMVFGTPAYLAPERLVGEVVVPATDVYALGLLVYRCLTDRLPWDADTPTQMIANHVYEPPSPLPAIDGLPDAVARLIGRCLAKEPDDRPSARRAATILAAATGIHVVLPGQDGAATQEVTSPVRALIPPPAAVFPSALTVEPGRPAHRAPRKGRRSRRAIPIAAAAVAVLGASALGFWTVRRNAADGGMTPPDNSCRVNFYIQPRQLGDGKFDARVTVVNTGKVGHKPWSLQFVFGTQSIVQADGLKLEQGKGPGGNHITLSGFELPGGKATVVGLVGQTGSAPGPPTDFALNGVRCDPVRMLGDPLPPTTGVIPPPPDLDAPHNPPAPPPGPPPTVPPPNWPSNLPWPPPPPPGPPPGQGQAAPPPYNGTSASPATG